MSSRTGALHVMAGLDPAIHRSTSAAMDGRVKPGHDGGAGGHDGGASGHDGGVGGHDGSAGSA